MKSLEDYSWLLVASIGCVAVGIVGEIPLRASPGSPAMSAESPAIQSVRLPPPSSASARSLFEQLPAAQTGIDLVHEFPTNAPFDLLTDQCSGAGVCLGDYDGDGLPDVFISNYDRGNRLYRNLGNWRFMDVTEQAKLGGSGRWCAGVTFVDINNDGRLDLFVCVFNSPNLLYLNQGDGTFKEAAQAYGLDFSGASVMMAFMDYDRDGYLDGYLVTHRLNVGTSHRLPRTSTDALNRAVIRVSGQGQIRVNPPFQELFDTIDKGNGRTELIIAGQQDRLYHHNTDGTFAVSNTTARIIGHDIGLAATWWDFNEDGYPDLYVSNDYRGPDRLYRNEGHGVFSEVAGIVLPHVPWASMGADLADINNDGHLDLFAADMSGATHFRRHISMTNLQRDRWFLESGNPRQYPRNAVYLSTGTERAMEVAWLTGLANTDWTWSPKFADLDNDGWIDLFLTTGMSRDFVDNDLVASLRERGASWRNAPVLRQAHRAFRNLGDLRFQSVGREWGLDHVSASYGAAFADLDRDGNLDLVVASFGEPVSVYRNEGTTGHRILIRLKGTLSNSWGIGSTVRIETPTGAQMRYLTLSSGFASSNEPLLHFGLGPQEKIGRLTVSWPSGQSQSFDGLDADRFYTITEPTYAVLRRPEPIAPTLFTQVEPLAGVRHHEQPFDDFLRQPLLPWKLSQLGPGLAIGDVDGDGLEDLYLGGAAGQAGRVCRRDRQGHFSASPQPAFEEDKAAEDAGACLFDADGDGDLDLYVVSGGVRCEPGDRVLCDRLYLNDGKGHFAKAPEGTLPDARDSGSVVTAADFDRDGDLDLFVGGRSIPGAYPLAPTSHLLVNEGGKFIERTDEFAPGLKQVGLVTSALWSDVNGDGWLDLLITLEWGPIKLFLNNNGRLEDRTKEAGLDLRGWWNGIAAGDLNGDGNIDYVVTNFGLNTRYRATPREPALLFYGPFDDTGAPHLIEAYYENGILLPVRGKACVTAVMPSLAAKFPTYASYARASLTDIYGARWLEGAKRFEINTLESGVLLNDGTGHFKFRPLPRLAQAAPSFGVVITDIDGDGRPDLYLAQNFFGPQSETGHMDGGVSLLLRGNGDGTFTPVQPKESGLLVPGDAKSLVVTDLNGDGWPDFVVGVNDGEPLAFVNRGSMKDRVLNFLLSGRAGNPTAIGARVTVTRTDGSTQAAEVHAGGGYLSQSSPVLTFGLGQTSQVKEIRVRWPNGVTTSARTDAARASQPLLVLKQPDR
jgi:hypothetical protein